MCPVPLEQALLWAPGADACSPSPDSRVPSNRVAMVSRKVFWGASNPFITGIFPARCEVPHQSLPTRVVREESAEGARGREGGGRGRDGEKDGEEDGEAAAPPPGAGSPLLLTQPQLRKSSPSSSAADGRGRRGAPLSRCGACAP